MINHYKDIIELQLELMVNSGLYERLSKIYVGCVGEFDEYLKLKDYFKGYKKIEIHSMSKDIKEYEYITLNILKNKSRELKRFYGFYIHTKGCNYPGNEGGKYWLDYMNYYNLERWEDAVTNLDIGYETYGVKLIPSSIPPAYKMHYSGNFFWFDSEYVTWLQPVYDFDIINRGNAEMWICTGHPIASTACQMFVDYDTKGKFKPFKIESSL